MTESPAGSTPRRRGSRRERFARDHPGLYAARHVAKGREGAAAPSRTRPAAPAAAAPLDPLPDIDLPSLPLPSIDLPAKYWGPILAGIVLAVREWRKRRRRPGAT